MNSLQEIQRIEAAPTAAGSSPPRRRVGGAGRTNRPWRFDAYLQRGSTTLRRKKQPQQLHVPAAIVEREDEDDFDDEQHTAGSVTKSNCSFDSNSCNTSHWPEQSQARLLAELKDRLQRIYTGHFPIVETIAHGGTSNDNNKTRKPTSVCREEMDLCIRQLQTSVFPTMYMGNHHVVGQMDDLGVTTNDSMDDENQSNETHEQTWRQQLSQSLAAFDALHSSRKDDDEWTEYTVQEESVVRQPEDDCWTEYTVQQESVAMMGSSQQPNSHHQPNDDDLWTECTVQDDESVDRDDERAVLHLNAVKGDKHVKDDDYYDCYTEYTIDTGRPGLQDEGEKQGLNSRTTTSTTSRSSSTNYLETLQPSSYNGGSAEQSVAGTTTNGSFVITLKLKSPKTENTQSVSDDESSTTNDCYDEGSDSGHEQHVQDVCSPPTLALSSRSFQRMAELLRKDIWSRDTAIVLSALQELSKEAALGTPQRAAIAQLGGLLAIVRAMESHTDHAGIQIAACSALDAMAVDHQLALGNVGGILAIVAAMKGHVDNVQVQQAACSALASITNQNAIHQVPADGAVETIVVSMMRHAGSPKVQENAFKALSNLCLDDQERLKELSQAGGLAAMTVALQRPWENHAEKHEAISTLSILLRSLAECDQ